MIYTPEMNDGEHVFCFGSNLKGVHGAGAAATALKHWGAKWGQGNGLQGQSYAIPTKDEEIKTLPLSAINFYVGCFVMFAKSSPNLIFLVTPIGTGLAGLDLADIAPMFRDAPDNCILPDGWRHFSNPETSSP